jgi:hypothetical protein
MPSTHESPEPHVKPAQHVAPAVLQPPTGPVTSSELLHSPPWQMSPLQQSRDPVHAASRGAQQALPSHERPRQQSDVRMQRVPDPPAVMQHASPAPQRKPSSQMRPAQHGPDARPHGPLGVTLPSFVPASIPFASARPSGLAAHPIAKNEAKKIARPMALILEHRTV